MDDPKDVQPAAHQPGAESLLPSSATLDGESADSLSVGPLGEPGISQIGVASDPFGGRFHYSERHIHRILGAQSTVAIILAGIFGVTVLALLIFSLLAHQLNLDPRDVRDLGATLITPEVALLGSVIGFYFAERRK